MKQLYWSSSSCSRVSILVQNAFASLTRLLRPNSSILPTPHAFVMLRRHDSHHDSLPVVANLTFSLPQVRLSPSVFRETHPESVAHRRPARTNTLLSSKPSYATSAACCPRTPCQESLSSSRAQTTSAGCCSLRSTRRAGCRRMRSTPLVSNIVPCQLFFPQNVTDNYLQSSSSDIQIVEVSKEPGEYHVMKPHGILCLRPLSVVG